MLEYLHQVVLQFLLLEQVPLSYMRQDRYRFLLRLILAVEVLAVAEHFRLGSLITVSRWVRLVVLEALLLLFGGGGEENILCVVVRHGHQFLARRCRLEDVGHLVVVL